MDNPPAWFCIAIIPPSLVVVAGLAVCIVACWKSRNSSMTPPLPHHRGAIALDFTSCLETEDPPPRDDE